MHYLAVIMFGIGKHRSENMCLFVMQTNAGLSMIERNKKESGSASVRVFDGHIPERRYRSALWMACSWVKFDV